MDTKEPRAALKKVATNRSEAELNEVNGTNGHEGQRHRVVFGLEDSVFGWYKPVAIHFFIW
jgi:hypothetical protein